MTPYARCPSALALALSLAVCAPAAAVDVGFDDLGSLSDVAQAAWGGVSVSTALVLSEADAATLTGYPTQGTWATSGTGAQPRNGLLNTLAPTIRFTFDVPVTAFSIDVLALPKDGITPMIALTAHGAAPGSAASLVASDPNLIGDSGLHEQRLSLDNGLFDSIELEALFGGCGSEPCDSPFTTTFWLDSASFTPVPEPGTMTLLGAGLAVVAGAARRRGPRA